MVDKEVYFGIYCKTCKYGKQGEDVPPCGSCLEEPCNDYSHKPIFWEEK